MGYMVSVLRIWHSPIHPRGIVLLSIFLKTHPNTAVGNDEMFSEADITIQRIKIHLSPFPKSKHSLFERAVLFNSLSNGTIKVVFGEVLLYNF